jgi:hypothetical protein
MPNAYAIHAPCRSGTQGMVVQCTERATGREFAVKKIAVRQYVSTSWPA